MLLGYFQLKIVVVDMSYYPFFLIVFILILSLPILMITTSKILRFIIGYTNNTSDSIYECGEPRVQNSWTKIPISYYRIALIFILLLCKISFLFNKPLLDKLLLSRLSSLSLA